MTDCKHDFMKLNRYDNSINSPDLQVIKEECLNCEMIISSEFYDGRKISHTTMLIKKGNLIRTPTKKTRDVERIVE